MEKIGVFYGPQGGSTEKVAKIINSKFNSLNVIADLIPIKIAKASDINRYQNIIFGCSTTGGETWDASKTKSDWDVFRSELDKIDYNGKTFALFGLGDIISYPRNFVDTMGIIAKIMISKNAKIVGQTKKDDYEFIDSEAVIDGRFIGLPIDEDFEPDKTETRIKRWVDAVIKDFH